MRSSAQQLFDELFKDQENNYCFECGAPANHWASVNNGIFLCLSCSGLHRGFGVNVSFVRSINMDSWTDLQLAMMKNGGNASLRACFDNYEIPKDAPMDYKYRTKAGAYYREMLKALADGRPLPNPPSHNEGKELAPTKAAGQANITGFGSSPAPEDSTGDKVTAFVGTVANKTVSLSKEAAQKVSDPVFQAGVKQGISTLGTAVASGAKNVATKVKDPAFQEDVKAFGGKVAVGTKEVAGKVADKSKEIWQNRDEYMTKGSEIAKMGFTTAVSFFKGFNSANANNGSGNANK